MPARFSFRPLRNGYCEPPSLAHDPADRRRSAIPACHAGSHERRRVAGPAPARPDTRAYRDYRHFLLETSQVVGGFYSSQGLRALLRQVVDLMLSPEDPYQALTSGKAAPRQQLRLVR